MQPLDIKNQTGQQPAASILLVEPSAGKTGRLNHAATSHRVANQRSPKDAWIAVLIAAKQGLATIAKALNRVVVSLLAQTTTNR